MNTTNLFVELIVIGAGAFAAIAFLTLSIFGYSDWAFALSQSPILLASFLPIVYVLGILTDRLAHSIFHRLWDCNLKKQMFGTSFSEYELTRLKLYQNDQRVAETIDYGRHRLRIARGWTVNAIMLIITVNVFLLRTDSFRSKGALSLYGTTLLGFLALGGYLSWKKIVTGEYRVLNNWRNEREGN